MSGLVGRMAGVFTDEWRDDRDADRPVSLELNVETPENVVLSYQLAGPSIRCAAYLLDFLVRGAITFFIFLLIQCLLVVVPVLQGTSTGLLLVFWFVMEWGYYVICEGFFHGKTVGKNAFGLRVIQANGHPLSFWSAFLRNLMRAIDGFLLYGVAFVSMLASRNFRRLGDLVAQTVVIQERRVVLPREPVIVEKIQPLVRDDINSFRPSRETLSLVDEFLGRRKVLSHDRGHAMARVISQALAKKLNYMGDRKQVDHYPMAFLARVYVTFIRREDGGMDEVIVEDDEIDESFEEDFQRRRRSRAGRLR
ncbi:MAG: RDD family protein [Planctomycetota bacterium]|nr:RDD family protein [Planctomycetota bacterium]